MDYRVENGHFLLHVRAPIVAPSGLCSHLICQNVKGEREKKEPKH